MKTSSLAATDEVENLARAHGRSLIAFAYVLSGDAELAQDLVQTVLGKMLGVDHVKVADPVAYARRAITNEFIEGQRRSARWLRSIRLTRADATQVESPESNIAERDALLRAFAVLSPRERAAVVLRYYEGWTDDSIARTLACAPGTVRSLLSRAMPKLRASLGEQPYGSGRSRHE